MYDASQLTIFLGQFDNSKRDMLLNAYSKSLNQQYELCEEAYAEKDLKKILACSHDVKSLALTVGYTELGELARFMEQNSKSENVKETMDKMPEFMAQINNLIEVIDSHIKERRRA